MTTALKTIEVPNSVYTDEFRFAYCLDVRCKCGFNHLSVYQEKETNELFTLCGLCLSIERYEETREEMREASLWPYKISDLIGILVDCLPQGNREEMIEDMLIELTKHFAKFDKTIEERLNTWLEWKEELEKSPDYKPNISKYNKRKEKTNE